jgi:hypothetical protein
MFEREAYPGTRRTGSQLRIHRNRVPISLSETKDRAKVGRLTVKSVRGSSFPRSNERMPPRAFLLSAITMDRGISEREIGFAGRDTNAGVSHARVRQAANFPNAAARQTSTSFFSTRGTERKRGTSRTFPHRTCVRRYRRRRRVFAHSRVRRGSSPMTED